MVLFGVQMYMPMLKFSTLMFSIVKLPMLPAATSIPMVHGTWDPIAAAADYDPEPSSKV